MSKVPILTFHDGGKIPQLGLGTAEIDRQAVEDALKIGYRYFDCAYHYKTEDKVGEAIKNFGLPRDQLFITSKVWRSHMTKEKA